VRALRHAFAGPSPRKKTLRSEITPIAKAFSPVPRLPSESRGGCRGMGPGRRRKRGFTMQRPPFNPRMYYIRLMAPDALAARADRTRFRAETPEEVRAELA
jgi:hypothetical protein